MNINRQLTLFVECLLAADRTRCFALVREWEQQHLSDDSLYSDIIIPAMIQVGLEWEANKHSIVMEHIATRIVKQILAYKAFQNSLAPRNGKTAMIGCVPNEHHEVASMILANVLERDGWHVLNYGSSVPKSDLVRSAGAVKPDLLCFTMKSIGSLMETESLLRDLRGALPSSKIMLGGVAMPGVRAVLSPYVDIFAESFHEGVEQARALHLKK